MGCVMGLLLFTGKLDGVGTAAPQQDAAQNTQQDAAQNEKQTQSEQQTQNATQGEQKDQNAVAAIPFTLKDQYGKTHTLADYKGKIVFLNFWATWCPPCRAEMPDIQKLYERSPRDGKDAVIVLGVAAPKLGGEKDEQERQTVRSIRHPGHSHYLSD